MNRISATVARQNALVLPYQMKFVDRILDAALAWDHILYTITNEGWAGVERPFVSEKVFGSEESRKSSMGDSK